MVADYNGSPDTDQLSVQKGQQVEVLENPCPGKPNFSLVRLPHTGAESPVEGIVPSAALKISQINPKLNTSSVPASPEVDNGT